MMKTSLELATEAFAEALGVTTEAFIEFYNNGREPYRSRNPALYGKWASIKKAKILKNWPRVQVNQWIRKSAHSYYDLDVPTYKMPPRYVDNNLKQYSAEETIRHIQETVKLMEARGIKVFLSTILPRTGV
jgi:bisphosphoglycerate-dependent phosphoglycerate mutase